MSESFEPVIIGFTCNWCSYRAADHAGMTRTGYPPNVRLIRVMCSGRIDPTFVLKALSEGADGVLIAGCHPGECHYLEQNYKALRRHRLLQKTLAQFGIAPERVRLAWASAAEGVKFAGEITDMVAEIKKLGPLDWPLPPSPLGASSDLVGVVCPPSRMLGSSIRGAGGEGTTHDKREATAMPSPPAPLPPAGEGGIGATP